MSHASGSAGRKMVPGALLLELLIALTIFVAAGLTVLAVIRQSVGDARAVDLQLRAQDLVFSAAARIASGVSTPEQEHGPVPVWSDDEANGGFDDRPPPSSGWSIRVETSRSGFGDAGLIRISALRGEGEERQAVAIASTVLIARTGRVREDDALPEDETFRAIDRIQERTAQ